MPILDQNSALTSTFLDLHPGPNLIDGRTERDDIAFVAEYAGLINFFGNNNNLHGSWQPFMLKDPVFLLAVISRCRYNRYYTPYQEECRSLDGYFTKGTTDVSEPFRVETHLNLLFDYIFNVFDLLAHWSWYMVMPDHNYDLRNYTIRQIEERLGPMFWAMVTLKNSASAKWSYSDTRPIEYEKLVKFEDYPWTKQKGVSVSEQLLKTYYHGRQEGKTRSYQNFYDAARQVGDALFVFFRSVIDHAVREYDHVKHAFSPFPDTLLLRTLIDSISIQRAQLNTLAEKHLAFYYNDVLKQTPETGQPDMAYICVASGKKNIVVALQKGTLFNAGLSASKTPILFSTTDQLSVNPATINKAYTLCRTQTCRPAANNGNGITSGVAKIVEKLTLSSNMVGAVQKGADGSIIGWNSFGDDCVKNTNPGISVSTIFASPMLLLRGGTRVVTLDFTFSGAYDDIMSYANVYLSTASAWLPITDFDQRSATNLTFTLQPGKPPIVPFSKNPEGISSPWPLLKLEFANVPNWSIPTIISKVQISVDVSSLLTSVLYNDYGPIGGKVPLQFLGPVPLPGSTFVFGNDEVFSKPTTSLEVTFTWGALPAMGFPNYYLIYNNYLDKTKEQPNDHFDDHSFKAEFTALNEGSWVDMKSYYSPNEVYPPSLFVIDTAQDTSYFQPATTYTFNASPGKHIFDAVPSLQNATYAYSLKSTSGFVRLTLTGNNWGFGSTLYPKVLTYATLKNVDDVIGEEKQPCLLQRFGNKIKSLITGRGGDNQKADPAANIMPNVPFVPLMNAFEINNYKAQSSFVFGSKSVDGTNDISEPIQCYYATPFGSELVYDNKQGVAASGSPILPCVNSYAADAGVYLFPPISAGGYMLLEINTLTVPCELSLYFQLAPATFASVDALQQNIAGYYLSASGWKPLDIASDGTFGFSCSGILKLNISADIASIPWLGMTGEKSWVAIAATGSLAGYGKVIFLGVNGVAAIRAEGTLPGASDPQNIPAGSITKTQAAVPGVVSVSQPFPSTGGKRSETNVEMNMRVSQRLYTKSRAVTASDYYRMLSLEFQQIFYISTGFNKVNGKTNIWVLTRYNDWQEANAFSPRLTTCLGEAIKDYLHDKTSLFSKPEVGSFSLCRVSVKAEIAIKTGYSFGRVKGEVEHAINIYLSPWITSDLLQLAPGRVLTAAGIATVIKGVEGVDDVQHISFNNSLADVTTGSMLASALAHDITKRGEAKDSNE